MNLLLVFDHRFLRDAEGTIYSAQNYNYPFFENNFLSIFDKVSVLARLAPSEDQAPIGRRADGERVEIIDVGAWTGVTEFWRNRHRILGRLNDHLKMPSAVLMIAPGMLASSAFKQLVRVNRPYGLHVVGDPYDVFAPGVVTHPLRPLLRRYGTGQLKKLAIKSSAASYVTEWTLQQRYPAAKGAFTIGCSDVDLADSAFALRPRSWMANRPPKRLVAVGSMAQMYKGHDVLIEALRHCLQQGQQLHLTLVGDGKYRAHLEQLAEVAGLNDHITFAGQVPAGEPVRAYLDQSDVFVMPSRTEGMPRAMIEAMARALPCVGSAVGGIRELLPQKDLVPPGDPATLAQQLIRLTSDPLLMAQESERNLERARDFHRDLLHERRLTFYRALKERTEAWLVNSRG